tara:strand:+ start:621 stop:1445 length:825 start_codon:yes stop_codon:yes gene_type:complete
LKRERAIAILIFAGALWSLGGVLIKSIPWPPLAISGLRSGVAALVIYFFSRNNKITFSKSKILAACFYALVVILFVIANKLTTAGNAILLQYTAPVYVALFGYMFLKEKSTIIDWLTIVVLLIGLGLFFIDELTLDGFTGNILAAVSGICFAALTLLLRKQKDDSPSDSVLLGNIITFIIGMPFISSGITIEMKPILLVLILGVFQLGIPYVLYTIAIKHLRALDAIIFPIIEPILNPILVFLILGESLGPWAFLGGTMVLGSVVLRAILKHSK